MLSIDEKVKEEKKPELIQSTSALQHLLVVLTKVISFASHTALLHFTCRAYSRFSMC